MFNKAILKILINCDNLNLLIIWTLCCAFLRYIFISKDWPLGERVRPSSAPVKQGGRKKPYLA